jgi:hypothetical protein
LFDNGKAWAVGDFPKPASSRHNAITQVVSLDETLVFLFVKVIAKPVTRQPGAVVAVLETVCELNKALDTLGRGFGTVLDRAAKSCPPKVQKRPVESTSILERNLDLQDRTYNPCNESLLHFLIDFWQIVYTDRDDCDDIHAYASSEDFGPGILESITTATEVCDAMYNACQFTLMVVLANILRAVNDTVPFCDLPLNFT